MIELAELLMDNKEGPIRSSLPPTLHGKPLHGAIGEVEGAAGFLTICC